MGAERGDPTDQFHLGLRYLRGEGVRQNRQLGVQWIRTALTNDNREFPLSLETRNQALQVISRLEGKLPEKKATASYTPRNPNSHSTLSFKDLQGNSYENIEVVRVFPSGISYLAADKTRAGTIPFAAMPASIRSLFLQGTTVPPQFRKFPDARFGGSLVQSTQSGTLSDGGANSGDLKTSLFGRPFSSTTFYDFSTPGPLRSGTVDRLGNNLFYDFRGAAGRIRGTSDEMVGTRFYDFWGPGGRATVVRDSLAGTAFHTFRGPAGRNTAVTDTLGGFTFHNSFGPGSHPSSMEYTLGGFRFHDQLLPRGMGLSLDSPALSFPP